MKFFAIMRLLSNILTIVFLGCSMTMALLGLDYTYFLITACFAQIAIAHIDIGRLIDRINNQGG